MFSDQSLHEKHDSVNHLKKKIIIKKVIADFEIPKIIMTKILSFVIFRNDHIIVWHAVHLYR